MSKQRKYSYEEKLRACEDYFSGKRSPSQIANDFGLSKISGGIRHWFRSYQNGGVKAIFSSVSCLFHCFCYLVDASL